MKGSSHRIIQALQDNKLQPSIISVSSVASACEHLDIEHIEAGMSTSFSIDKISEFVHVASLEFDGTTTHTYIHTQSHIYIYTLYIYIYMYIFM